ncbi:amidohydrolase family protein [Sphingomonas aerophila]|uniref:L-fuconolactonase n=1 Tax=Sphingomonas aerophila TaxID=1344948 RepID=A0A7W9EUY1_9SPHN|nr:L-fuconolactonase [Sphingomonas aerophila]
MIDAHVHVWRIGENGFSWPPPSLSAIHRHFSLQDWRKETAPVAAEGVILVQSQEDPADTAWLLELADRDPAVLGVVGWTNLEAPDAPQAIARLAGHSRLRGLRPMVQDCAADWYDNGALEPAWAAMEQAGLVLEALIRPAHLSSLNRLAARHPELAIVIDHAGKPDPRALEGWRRDLSSIAARPQVRCKLSGLLTELSPDMPAGAIEPIVSVLVDLFGTDRLMWGSDWPVLTLAGNYAGWLEQARRLVPPSLHDAVFGGTARATYGLTR